MTSGEEKKEFTLRSQRYHKTSIEGAHWYSLISRKITKENQEQEEKPKNNLAFKIAPYIDYDDNDNNNYCCCNQIFTSFY